MIATGTCFSLRKGSATPFMALTDDCTVLYLCSTYAPGGEHSVRPLDQ